MVDNREGKANVRLTVQKGLEGCEMNSLMVLSAISAMMWGRIRSSEVPAVEAFHFFRQSSRYCCSMNSRSLSGLVPSESGS